MKRPGKLTRAIIEQLVSDVILVDETTLEAEVPREEGINRLFHALSGAGVEVLGLRNKSNRLEEFFMRLVESQREAAH